MDTLTAVLSLEEHLLALRHHIHQNPELGWHEQETQALILRELEELGIPCETVCGTGVIATLEGGQPGPVVGLRADMDALPIQEKLDAPYCSRKDGVKHACGHDCHVAMLLTAARVLTGCRDQLHGTVKFIFQPAEEIIEGAHAMAQLPQIEGIDRIFGLHVWNDLDVGTFSVEVGPRLACADNIYLTIRGKSAHGAQPHNGVDAIVAACAVVEQLQTAVSRKVDPLEPVVVTIGTIHGGTASNIIADEVQLSGTVRCFNKDLRADLPRILEDLAVTTAQAHGATCEFKYAPCAPPVINEASSTAIAQKAVTDLFGADKLVHLEKTMGGEDFSWFLEKIPGCYIFVGARNEAAGKCWPHHHACFDVDERSLVNGTALLVKLALGNGKE